MDRRIYLLKHLLQENKRYSNVTIPKNIKDQKILLRALMNVRLPKEISPEFRLIQDEYLRVTNYQKGVVKSDIFHSKINIWQGDITRLKVDAIVNAANSGMTGCYVPNHSCIDNQIHTYAGIELRNYCAELMKKQGHEEEVGHAKITPGFNLPAKYVIHTVGPCVTSALPTHEDQQNLANSYYRCLELADKNGIKSIAFPCISTGVFHFPNELAAQIAVKTVKKFLQKETSIEKVIFNVYKEKDRLIYSHLLRQDSQINQKN